jgi:hypothetical protein
VSNIILHVLAFRVLTVWLQARLARDEHQKLREKRQRDHTQRREASIASGRKGRCEYIQASSKFKELTVASGGSADDY